MSTTPSPEGNESTMSTKTTNTPTVSPPVLTLVTPDMARDWLAANTDGNRNRNYTRVRNLAAIITDGGWKVTHQGIAFDSTGKLTDGQHRLAAIVAANVPVQMFVTFGIDAFAVIDTGTPRTAADVLHIGVHPQASAAAAALKLLIKYERGGDRPWDRSSNTGPAVISATAATAQTEILRSAIISSKKVAYRTKGAPSGFTAALYVCEQWATRRFAHPEYQGWVDGLASGVGLGDNDARLALASWVNGAGRLMSHSQRNELQMQLTIKAFHLHTLGKTMSRMQVVNPRVFVYRLPGPDFRIDGVYA
jgi:hypothetical protein